MFLLHYTVCLCLFLSNLEKVHSSAIPMWEFLSKEEKMSYLYSMFANQVDEYCGKSSMANCNKELLRYGLGKLKDMPEDHLDVMDPYQRGANELIWGSMMEGHEMMKSPNARPPTTTTPKPNSYDDQSFGEFGAASAKIDSVYRVSPPKGFVFTLQTGIPQYTYNHRQNIQNGQKNGVYTRFQQVYSTSTTNAPVLGPMEVKVYPDGRPVRQHVRLPQDDDLRQYQLQKTNIPKL